MAKQANLIISLKDKISAGLAKIGGKFGNFRAKIGKLNIATIALGSSLGIILAGAVRSAGRAIVGAISNVATFEKGLTNVFTLLSENDVSEFGDQLKETAKDAIRLGFAIEDTNKALFDTISAGVKAGESTKFFAVAQKLAIGGVTGLGVAVDGLTSVMNAYGRENFDAEKAANVFFTAQKDGKTTVDELANSIGKVAPVAAKVGVSFEETASAIATLTTSGVKTDLAVTGLKAALSGLANPADQARRAMKEYGIPVGVAELKTKGFGFALKKINQAFLENNDSIIKLFPNIRAFLAVAGLTEGALDRYDKTLQATRTDTTSLDAAVKKQTETLDFQWKALQGTTKTISLTILGQFVPAMKALVSTLKQAADFWDRFFNKVFAGQSELEQTERRVKQLSFRLGELIKLRTIGSDISQTQIDVVKKNLDLEIAKLKELKNTQKEVNEEKTKTAKEEVAITPQKKQLTKEEVNKIEKLKQQAQNEINLKTLTNEQIRLLRLDAFIQELTDMGLHEEAKNVLIANGFKSREELQKKTQATDKKLSQKQLEGFKKDGNAIVAFASSRSKLVSGIAKKAGIAQGTINSFKAFTAALANPPGPPFTIPVAAAALGAGLAKVAAIASTPLAEGGMIMPQSGGVSATLAEVGKPEVAIPLDDDRTAEKLQETLGGAGETNIIINAGTIVADKNSAIELAKMIDKELFDLRKTGQSVSF